MKRIHLLLPILILAATAVAGTPKNIVLILADDLGWADATLYGKTSLCETPNIERLAAADFSVKSCGAIWTFPNGYVWPLIPGTR